MAKKTPKLPSCTTTSILSGSFMVAARNGPYAAKADALSAERAGDLDVIEKTRRDAAERRLVLVIDQSASMTRGAFKPARGKAPIPQQTKPLLKTKPAATQRTRRQPRQK